LVVIASISITPYVAEALKSSLTPLVRQQKAWSIHGAPCSSGRLRFLFAHHIQSYWQFLTRPLTPGLLSKLTLALSKIAERFEKVGIVSSKVSLTSFLVLHCQFLQFRISKVVDRSTMTEMASNAKA
jgi:hypothetical protein